MEDKEKKNQKHKNLEEAGLLNQTPERVHAPLFREHPEFFDAHDALQVRYEMLRSHQVDKKSVVEICRRFRVSRQTFYNLQERFMSEGTAGLLPKKPGPKGPSKLTGEVLEFAEQQLKQDVQIAAAELQRQIEERSGVSFHRRTIEKLLKELRSKKNS